MLTNNSRNTSSKNRTATRSEAAEPVRYFDLHTKGCGYMSRIRWVTPKGNGRKSEKFLACAINAAHGNMKDPMYSYMDLRVSGEEAIDLVSSLLEDCGQDQKIFVAFVVGDIYAHTYWRDVKEDGRKTGEQEPAAILKGRLLLITHIAIDDVVVYHLDQDSREGVETAPSEDPLNDTADAENVGGESANGDNDTEDQNLAGEEVPFVAANRTLRAVSNTGGPMPTLKNRPQSGGGVPSPRFASKSRDLN